jgi:hypothetical protein
VGFVLAVVTFGHLLENPLYEFHTHVIPRLALLLFVLMLPREVGHWEADTVMGADTKDCVVTLVERKDGSRARRQGGRIGRPTR